MFQVRTDEWDIYEANYALSKIFLTDFVFIETWEASELLKFINLKKTIKIN